MEVNESLAVGHYARPLTPNHASLATMPQRAPDGTIAAQPQAPHRTGLAEDYAALEAALSAFPRRRWFLAEYARRSRTFIEQRITAMIEIWGVDDIAFKIDAIAARMGAFAGGGARGRPPLKRTPAQGRRAEAG
jgi:hypothetical protein